MDILGIVSELVAKFPVLSSVVMVIGVLRVINKPLFALLKAYVSSTPSVADDALLESVEKGKLYQWFSFVVDWFGSIKLPSSK